MFIVGVPRSGTTLLVNLLGHHPVLAPIYETRFLRNLLTLCRRACWYYGDSVTRDCARLIAEPLVKARLQKEFERYRSKVIAYSPIPPEGDGTKQSYEAFPYGESHCIRYDIEDLIRETDKWLAETRTAHASPASLCQSARKYVDALFGIHCARMKKPYWINKTPGLLTYLDLLPLLYPVSKCIHIIRDGRDVAVSNLSLPWGPKTVREAARRWKNLMLQGRKSAQCEGVSYVEVRYEDLINAPKETLNKAIAFLGMDGSLDGVLDYLRISNSRKEVWRSSFSAVDRRMFDREAGDLLIELGYENNDNWAK